MSTLNQTDPVDPAICGSVSRGCHAFLIGSRWIPAQSGQEFDGVDPARGPTIARVGHGGAADIHDAVTAARRHLT